MAIDPGIKSIFSGMTEPVFKPKEFLTPGQIRKIVIREVSEKKYRNM